MKKFFPVILNGKRFHHCSSVLNNLAWERCERLAFVPEEGESEEDRESEKSEELEEPAPKKVITFFYF